MLTMMLLALVGQQAALKPATPPRPGDIVVEGKIKEKRVCTTRTMTGSRARRERHCVTAAEAELEAQFARDAVIREGRQQGLSDAIACGAGTTKSCN